MYKLYAKIPATYTFTGNARQATFGVAADASLELHALSFAGADKVQLKGGNFRIVRARLVASGADGLEPGKEKIAGSMNLKLVYGGSDASNVFKLSFYKWDEWTEQDIRIGVYPQAENKDCGLAVVQRGTEFTCDDYNVDSAFVGQSFVPILELEIECRGLTTVVTP